MCTGPHDFIPAPDIVKVEFRYTMLGQQTMNVFYFFQEGGWTVTSMNAFADFAEDTWNTNIKPLLHAGTTLREIVVTELSAESSFQITNPSGAVGTRAGTPLPNNIALVVSFRTGLTGRSRRGRVYHSGVVEADVTENSFNNTQAFEIRTAYEDFFTSFIAEGDWVHVIVSYCEDGVWRENALITPVAAYTIVDTVVDSQRRRLPGRGD